MAFFSKHKWRLFVGTAVAAYLILSTIHWHEALSVEQLWKDRVAHDFPIGISVSEAEAKLKAYGLSSLWHRDDHYINAYTGYNARYFGLDYSLKIVVSLDANDRVTKAEIVRDNSAWI